MAVRQPQFWLTIMIS